MTVTIDHHTQSEINQAAAEEAAAGGGLGILAGDEEGKPLEVGQPGGEVGGPGLGELEGQGEPLQVGHETSEAPHEEPQAEEEPEAAELEEVSEPPAEVAEVEAPPSAKPGEKGGIDPKHHQRISEARLNELNRIKEDPSYQVGQAIAQNPALLQVFQAVSTGQVPLEQVVNASMPTPQATPLTPPTSPQRPADFNEAEVYTEGSASNIYQKQLNTYLADSISYLVSSDQDRKREQEAQLVQQHQELERGNTVQQLMNLYGYSEAEATSFYDKYSRPGSMTLDLLVRADKAQRVSPEENRRNAKLEDQKSRRTKLTARSPAAPVGGSGGAGAQEPEEELSEEELFNQALMEGDPYS